MNYLYTFVQCHMDKSAVVQNTEKLTITNDK